MRCEDGRQRLSRLVDGELDSADQAGLFGHLEGCGDLVRWRGRECGAHAAILMASRIGVAGPVG